MRPARGEAGPDGSPEAGAAASGERDGAPRSLREDQRGAVMVMGLFFACLLIGAMWAMKGMGDAILFRHRMQEAADHEVYAAAVVHARGMNLIAALNVVMKVIALIWLVLSVLKDLLILAIALLSACAAVWVTTAICGPLLGAATAAHTSLVNARNAYEQSVVNVGLPLLSGIETAAAISYPWYASTAAADVAATYGAGGVAVGASHVPGLAFDAPMDALGDGRGDARAELACAAEARGHEPGSSDDTKLGLPVVNEENKRLCELALDHVTDYFPPALGAILAWVAGAFTDAGGYCDGHPWETKALGWKRMAQPARNGGVYLQVWGMALPGAYDDGRATSKVALAQGTQRGVRDSRALRDEQAHVSPFVAQAEFFYDCRGRWGSSGCNGAPDASQATFNMKWRARLRPVVAPRAFGIGEAFALVSRHPGRFGARGDAPSTERVREGVALLRGPRAPHTPGGDPGEILH